MTLKEFVEEAGSVAEAARQLETPYGTIWRWLHGKAKPSRGMVALLKTKGVELGAKS